MIATTHLLSSPPSREAQPVLLANPTATGPDRERLRHIVIGSPAGVRETIHMLHVLNYVEQLHWTKLLAIPETGLILRPELGQVFSYLDRQR